MRRISLVVGLLALALAAPAPATTLLRLNGIGPLTLGMPKAQAVSTGWLKHQGHGCELGGKPFPDDFTPDGPKAPLAIDGTAEFNGRTGKLENLAFGKAVRTATGVVVGKTPATGM